jgi:hypothetical protein
VTSSVVSCATDTFVRNSLCSRRRNKPRPGLFHERALRSRKRLSFRFPSASLRVRGVCRWGAKPLEIETWALGGPGIVDRGSLPPRWPQACWSLWGRSSLRCCPGATSRRVRRRRSCTPKACTAISANSQVVQRFAEPDQQACGHRALPLPEKRRAAPVPSPHLACGILRLWGASQPPCCAPRLH